MSLAVGGRFPEPYGGSARQSRGSGRLSDSAPQAPGCGLARHQPGSSRPRDDCVRWRAAEMNRDDFQASASTRTGAGGREAWASGLSNVGCHPEPGVKPGHHRSSLRMRRCGSVAFRPACRILGGSTGSGALAVRTIGLNLVACLVLLLGLMLVQVPDAAAHVLGHGGAEATTAAEAAFEPASPCHASHPAPELHPTGHHQRGHDGGANHSGSCCVVGCGASGLPADPPGISRELGRERCAPALKTVVRGLGVAPPHGPPRSRP